MAQIEPLKVNFGADEIGTVWTEMPGTIKPKGVAQIEPNYPVNENNFSNFAFN